MKPPSIATRIMGSGIVAGASVLIGAPLAYGYFTTPDGGWILGMVVVALVARVIKANEQVMLYEKWKRAWDGMADQPSPRRRPLSIKRAGQVLGGLILITFVLANLGNAGAQTGMAIVGGVLVTWYLAKRLGMVSGSARSSRAKGEPVVTLAVRSPLLPVPTMQQAYAALPQQLWCLFGPAQ